ncbi:NAD+ synthase [Desulfurivibrio alkaliphilus]|uniref:Glutamine-dependent NAD(+) synthetase n=1 Tax=Desulfurivibrio alkaliphilus (strain DSM 19089 / UNIQEM U267 / AHT2) TaxID=589865 RepID=D6Z4Z7_DESAT|nr:NAD+ synthase [Desulfurivibrio alkaliphilus]ADH86622.1 NAD+ synthetase [Desulfurivibrio alkaliphilus AHT 2]
MKLALIQINPRIGDFRHNTEVIIDRCRRAANLGCELAVLPELAISGYPPEDLLERPDFLAHHQRALERLLKEIRGIGVLCGAIIPNPAPTGKPLHNAALLFADGEILATTTKRLLPTYDVFGESRYFEPGPPGKIIEFQGLRLAITICEDVWNHVIFTPHRPYHHDPVAELLGPPAARSGNTPAPADLLVNIAASPFESGKTARREQIFQTISRRYQIPLVFVNQVGGQDSLIFDGDSLAYNTDGRVICRAARFQEDLTVFALPQASGPGEETAPSAGANLPGADHDLEAAEILAALVLGTGDFVRKCGFSQTILGLSGGLDSALTAVIAAQALGPAKVLGLALPSAYSAPASQEDARALAANLGLAYEVLPIDQVLAAYRPALAPLLGDQSWPGLVEQNLQARIRGNLLMAESNRSGRLLLNTGNKSELAVGYCTLYGDMCGALAVLADVPKTMVYRLAKLVNREEEIIPRRTIERPPSAELAPGQRDDDELPPYEVLDPILQAYLEEQLEAAAIIQRGYPATVVNEVIERIHRNEHKRRQAPPGLKISGKAFGAGRLYPLTANYQPS